MADEQYVQQLLQREQKLIEEKARNLSAEEKQRLVTDAIRLKQRQDEKPGDVKEAIKPYSLRLDVEVLPTVRVADIPRQRGLEHIDIGSAGKVELQVPHI